LEVDIEQCRENDKIKEIITKSGLHIKYIKLLLRLCDTIYINAINYNVIINGKQVIILLISSKPENVTGEFHTPSLSIVLYKMRDIEKENDDITTRCVVEDNMIQVVLNIHVSL
jgi:hypothetical protein